MANILREQRIIDSTKRTLLKYVFISDGSSVANNTLVDVSSLKFALNANGFIMTSNTDIKPSYTTTIKRIFGEAKSNGYVSLQWAGDANSEIITFMSKFDYGFDTMGEGATISNPESNATGDILFSVVSPNVGDTFTLFIDLRKDAKDFDAGQTADPVAFNQGPARFI